MLRKPLVLALAVIMLIGVGHAAVAGRNGHENNGGQGGMRSEEQQQRALEQIRAAEEMIARADNLIGSLTHEPPPAAVVLLNQAKEHLANALEVFDESKFGEAYGLANAAEMLARNAIRMLEDTLEEEQPTGEENIQQPTEEQPSAGENAEQPTEEEEQPSIVWTSPDTIAQGESTTFYVDVASDLSEVSVYFESPSGAWAAWRNATGKTPDGLWYGEIKAPPEAGIWKITTLYIRDRSGNWWYHSLRVPFNVVAKDGKSIVINRIWTSLSVAAQGGSITLYADVTGDLSEVSFYCESPSRAFEGWRNASSRTSEGAWYGEITIPSDAEIGTWKITILYVSDRVGNWWYYRNNYVTLATFNVASTGDSEPLRINRVWVSPSVTAQGESVTFYVDITGDPSEVSVYCYSPSGEWGAWRGASKSSESGVWSGEIKSLPEAGTWRITAVSFTNKAGNWSGLVSINVTFEAR